MAYKQSPGRKAMPKTGRGISPTLMSCSAKKGSPMKQTSEPDLTRQGSESRKKVQAGAKNRAASAKTDPQGIKVDPKSGTATAKPYEKRYVKGGKMELDRIVDGAGKVISTASNKKGRDAGNAELRRSFVKDSTNNANMRSSNARAYNIQAGKVSPTAKEARSRQSTGFYAK